MLADSPDLTWPDPFPSILLPRELKLHYADVYELCVSLPYPVFDTKGVAKFDKGAKTLTLTLPVKAQAVPVIDRQPPAQEVEDDSKKQVVVDCSPAQSKQQPDRMEKAAAPKPQHSRWVATHSDEAVGEVKVGQEDDLASYIRTQAAQALKNAHSAVPSLASASASAPLSPPSPAEDPRAPLAAETLSPAADSAPFYPSAAYTGTRPGFVFKMDALGLGYYRDQVSVQAASSSSSQQAQEGPAVTVTPTAVPSQDSGAAPIQMRQSRSALAMIVQVR